ncbi:MAG: hypothetical protein NXH95_13660 [Pseudomonadaceae bacterium]|nr:hypothetical protein [Pseudomonadaceae bacterium]
MQVQRVFPQDENGNTLIPRNALPIGDNGKPVLPQGEHKIVTDEPVDVRVRVLKEPPRKQNFSPKLINTGMMVGWLRNEGGSFVFRTPDGEDDVVYRIVRAPGRYPTEDGGHVVNHFFECEVA